MVGLPSISGTGNGLANLLIGNGPGNVLAGEAGNDTLDGGAGNDTLKGGVGNDLYLVDSLNDVVEEGIGGGKDTIRATVDYHLSDSQEIESLHPRSRAARSAGPATARATGSPWSAPARRSWKAGTGNDTLTGGVGNDATARRRRR